MKGAGCVRRAPSERGEKTLSAMPKVSALRTVWNGCRDKQRSYQINVDSIALNTPMDIYNCSKDNANEG